MKKQRLTVDATEDTGRICSACVLASQFTHLPGQALLSKLSGLVPVQSQALASDGTAGHRHGEGEGQAGCVAHDKEQAGIKEQLVEEGLAKCDQRDMALREVLAGGQEAG